MNLFSTFKENQYFDRKSARKDDKEIAKHISAFANAAGGKLVIGIEDDGEVTGFKRSGATSKLRARSAHDLYADPHRPQGSNPRG